MTSYDQLDGKRALIEVREGRRWHRMVIATLRTEVDGVYAEFGNAYPRHYPMPAKIKIPPRQLRMFEPVQRPDYDLKFLSVLHLVDVESDDTPSCARPPIIVERCDIDAQKR